MPASLKHLSNRKLNLAGLLAKWQDGLYYKAAIVKCDKPKKRCLVCFEDNSEVWLSTRDIHIQLTPDQLNEIDDIVCCICDDGTSDDENFVILCDVCNQGYHQKCHSPVVDASEIDESEGSEHKDWICSTCSYILNQSSGPEESSSRKHETKQTNQRQAQQQQKQELQPKTDKESQQGQASQRARHHEPVAGMHQTQTAKVTREAPSSRQIDSQQQNQKSTVGPVKATTTATPRPAPYYPLSNQARVVASVPAAPQLTTLTPVTSGSAMVVGNSSGRSKQDLVNQSNRSIQRQHQMLQQPTPKREQPAQGGLDQLATKIKNAVRKSSVNFAPVRQSALPTAVRSTPISSPAAAAAAAKPTQPVSPPVQPSQTVVVSNVRNGTGEPKPKPVSPAVTSSSQKVPGHSDKSDSIVATSSSGGGAGTVVRAAEAKVADQRGTGSWLASGLAESVIKQQIVTSTTSPKQSPRAGEHSHSVTTPPMSSPVSFVPSSPRLSPIAASPAKTLSAAPDAASKVSSDEARPVASKPAPSAASSAWPEAAAAAPLPPTESATSAETIIRKPTVIVSAGESNQLS